MTSRPLEIRRDLNKRAFPGDVIVVSLLGILAAEDFTQTAHITVCYAGVFCLYKRSAFLSR